MADQRQKGSTIDDTNEDGDLENCDTERDCNLSTSTEADVFLQMSGGQNRFLQWFQALDLQVLGGCRAEERLKPLLKLNVPCGSAEDRLLAQLNQHFEASEVGLLARCLCLPLVSIRVGKVEKQGNLLIPTAARTILIAGNEYIGLKVDEHCEV